MNSGNKFLGLLVALMMIVTFGCARKQQPAPVYGSGVAPVSQPIVNASAPAPSSRTSNYIK